LEIVDGKRRRSRGGHPTAGFRIKVIHSYDPRYTDKIKLVAEAIERLENPDEIITGLELDLDFDRRFLRFDDPQRQPNLSLSPGSAR